MSNRSHSFYCGNCRQYMFADTPILLAFDINAHNNKLHPLDSSGWTGESVVKSAHYAGPYIVTAEVAGQQHWGGAKAPVITTQDRKLLKGLLVKWD